jgi:hypothetical protein
MPTGNKQQATGNRIRHFFTTKKNGFLIRNAI